MKKSTFKIIITIISIIFISSYLVASTGYYEYRMQEKTILTNEKIKQFEEDIKNKEKVDIKNYLSDDELNYSNNFTNIVYTISKDSTKVVQKAIKALFKKLSYLIED